MDLEFINIERYLIAEKCSEYLELYNSEIKKTSSVFDELEDELSKVLAPITFYRSLEANNE